MNWAWSKVYTHWWYKCRIFAILGQSVCCFGGKHAFQQGWPQDLPDRWAKLPDGGGAATQSFYEGDRVLKQCFKLNFGTQSMPKILGSLWEKIWNNWALPPKIWKTIEFLKKKIGFLKEKIGKFGVFMERFALI